MLSYLILVFLCISGSFGWPIPTGPGNKGPPPKGGPGDRDDGNKGPPKGGPGDRDDHHGDSDDNTNKCSTPYNSNNFKLNYCDHGANNPPSFSFSFGGYNSVTQASLGWTQVGAPIEDVVVVSKSKFGNSYNIYDGYITGQNGDILADDIDDITNGKFTNGLLEFNRIWSTGDTDCDLDLSLNAPISFFYNIILTNGRTVTGTFSCSLSSGNSFGDSDDWWD